MNLLNLAAFDWKYSEDSVILVSLDELNLLVLIDNLVKILISLPRFSWWEIVTLISGQFWVGFGSHNWN